MAVVNVCFSLLVLLMMASHALGEEANKTSTYIVLVDPGDADTVPVNNLDGRRKLCASIVEKSMRAAGVHNGSADSRILYVYENVMTGFAARLTKVEVYAMQNVSGFLYALPDAYLSLHTTYSSQFLGLSPLNGLWPRTGFGKGIIIGVVDSGVWPESASFSDEGVPPAPPRWKGFCQAGPGFNASSCNKKLIGARVFSKGAQAAGWVANNTARNTPRDFLGHGTQIASTAGGNFVANADIFGYANGTAKGMAPHAHVAIYKVCFGIFKACTSSDVLAAMDQAIVDGVDMLSLSIAALSQPFYNDAIAIAAFRAMERGIFVTSSAGNDGPDYYSVSNDAPWIMTVGAGTTGREFVANVRLGNDKVLYGETLYLGNGKGTKELPLVYAGEENTCFNGSLDPRVVQGKVVICNRQYTDDEEHRILKGEVVREAGGAGMILVNNEENWDNSVADAHVLPATNVGFSKGTAIASYVNSTETPTASFEFYGTVFGTKSAPSVASFSSRGPSGFSPGTLKPDVIAPGVDVLGAWPSDLSVSGLPTDKRSVNFNTMCGTSMAAPHVTGLAALVKSAHPDWSPAAIKSALITTADIENKKGGHIMDNAINASANVFATGAGHVNIGKAANPGLVYDIGAEDYIPYLCGLHYSARQIRGIVGKNVNCPQSSDEITLLGNLNYPSFALLITEVPSSVTFTRTVTNVGPSNLTYSVNVVPPQGVEVTVIPNTLSFTTKHEKKSYNVTFAANDIPPPTGLTSFSQGYIMWVSMSSGYKLQVRSPVSVNWSPQFSH